MRTDHDDGAARRAPSLLRFSMVSTAIFGTLVALVAVALVWSASLFYRSISEVVRDVRSQTIAGEIELALLTYQRVSTLRVLTGEEELDEARAPLVSAMWDMMEEAETYVGTSSERGGIEELGRQLSAYLATRQRLEAAGLDADEIIRRAAGQLNEVLDDLDALRELNDAQVQRAQAEAERWADIASAIGIGAGSTLVLGLLLGAFGIHRYALAPLFELHGTIARYKSGQPEARAATSGFREVSELARGYNDMADALARQREAQLTFLAGVAHDLRNPLTGIKLGIHALEQEPQSPASRSRTRTRLDRQVDRLARMVEDLLDATRIEAGKLELRRESFDVRDAVADIVDLYEPTSPDHRITWDAPPSPVMIDGDPLRIEQVLSNLLSNAIKFSPAGGPITITVRAEDDHVVLAVSDRGIGIRRDQLSSIFEPFQRRSPGIAPGAGLGLSVVRRIVLAHGGTIDVASEAGQGATFRIALPRTKEPASDR